MQRHVLLCYDICNERRLRRVHGIARDFGVPIQYSIFLCRLTPGDRVMLITRLLRALDPSVDQVMLVDMGKVTRSEATVPGTQVLGCSRMPADRGPKVL